MEHDPRESFILPTHYQSPNPICQLLHRVDLSLYSHQVNRSTIFLLKQVCYLSQDLYEEKYELLDRSQRAQAKAKRKQKQIRRLQKILQTQKHQYQLSKKQIQNKLFSKKRTCAELQAKNEELLNKNPEFQNRNQTRSISTQESQLFQEECFEDGTPQKAPWSQYYQSHLTQLRDEIQIMRNDLEGYKERYEELKNNYDSQKLQLQIFRKNRITEEEKFEKKIEKEESQEEQAQKLTIQILPSKSKKRRRKHNQRKSAPQKEYQSFAEKVNQEQATQTQQTHSEQNDSYTQSGGIIQKKFPRTKNLNAVCPPTIQIIYAFVAVVLGYLIT